MNQEKLKAFERFSSLMLKQSIILFIAGIIIAGVIVFIHQDSISVDKTKQLERVDKNITYVIEQAQPKLEDFIQSVSKL